MKDESKNDKKVPVECYTRVVGFFRPTSQFNKGKAEEFKDRKPYNVKKYTKGDLL
jgi:anaerobic ribonucleoside-triphosphate reductase